MEQNNINHKEITDHLRLRAAARDARSTYTKELFKVVVELMNTIGLDELADKIGMSSSQLTESAIDGDFTIEQAGQLCHLAGREFVFVMRWAGGVYDPEDNPNGK